MGINDEELKWIVSDLVKHSNFLRIIIVFFFVFFFFKKKKTKQKKNGFMAPSKYFQIVRKSLDITGLTRLFLDWWD